MLDVNSLYTYLLIGEHHAGTSVVACAGDELIGFISGYLLPGSPETLFIWQVGVSEAGRGRGLATHMLLDILSRDVCRDVRYLDTTIGPSNVASQALFRGLARRLDCDVTENELFSHDLFAVHASGDEPHEPEILFHIGPFDRTAIRAVSA